MAENKKSFILYADLLKSIEHLTNEEKGILFNHLLEYVNDKNPVLKDRLILTAWKPIELQLKRDLVKFEEVRIKRSHAGKKSAQIKSQQNSTKSTLVESVKHRSTNSTDNVNDNVNDNVINKESNFYFEEDSKTSNTLHEMTLQDYGYDLPKPKDHPEYTQEQKKTIISTKGRALDVWSKIQSLSDTNKKQKIDFVVILNKQLAFGGYDGYVTFATQLHYYLEVQKRENYKYIVKLPKLVDTVNEKDWKLFWEKSATEEELDPEPYLPPCPSIDPDSPEFIEWEKQAAPHGEWRKRRAVKMFKAGL